VKLASYVAFVFLHEKNRMMMAMVMAMVIQLDITDSVNDNSPLDDDWYWGILFLILLLL